MTGQTMRVAVGASCLAAVLTGAATRAPQTETAPSRPDVALLDRLVSERRFFEVRDALEASRDETSLDALFYRGVTASRFNRVDEATRLLTAFVQQAGTHALTAYVREAYATLADLHRRAHRYAALVDSRRQMVAAFKPHLEPAEIADLERRLRLWNALRDVPPQTVEIGAGADVPLVNGIDIAVAFPAGEVLLNPDTGSGLSIIARSDAARLGLQLVEVPVDVTTVAGQAPATLGIAPQMRIGGVVVRHAVFLVFPDAALFRARQGVQRHGTVGAPVLTALGDITFTRAGRFIAGPPSRPVAGADMFLEDLDPIVDARFNGRHLRMAVDTGADETTFSSLFHREFAEALPAGWRRVEREVGTVGGTRRLAMLEVNAMAIDIGSHRLAFPDRRLVAIEPTNDDSRVFHGSLGRDVFRLRDRLTVSYTSMRVVID